jgi:hypothetical protein
VFSGMPASTPTRPPSPTSTRTCSARARYTGKGIYDVDAFEAAMAGRVPENALLSHDLFEGTFARAGLVTDIEVFEEFPSRYDVAARAAPLGARRLAAAAVDPRPRARDAAAGEPEVAALGIAGGRCSTTCAGRCPRRSPWPRSSRLDCCPGRVGRRGPRSSSRR